MVKIYTKTGDKGTTSLYNGERKDKSDVIFEVLGSLDEANVALGFAGKYNSSKIILELQGQIIHLSSHIASRKSESGEFKVLFKLNIKNIESLIDNYELKLDPLRDFILPGGCEESCWLHEARVRVRRAERNLVILLKEKQISEESYIYVNRLSDLLFSLARYANKVNGINDVISKVRLEKAESYTLTHLIIFVLIFAILFKFSYNFL